MQPLNAGRHGRPFKRRSAWLTGTAFGRTLPSRPEFCHHDDLLGKPRPKAHERIGCVLRDVATKTVPMSICRTFSAMASARVRVDTGRNTQPPEPLMRAWIQSAPRGSITASGLSCSASASACSPASSVPVDCPGAAAGFFPLLPFLPFTALAGGSGFTSAAALFSPISACSTAGYRAKATASRSLRPIASITATDKPVIGSASEGGPSLPGRRLLVELAALDEALPFSAASCNVWVVASVASVAFAPSAPSASTLLSAALAFRSPPLCCEGGRILSGFESRVNSGSENISAVGTVTGGATTT